jgi:hypothetical protein
MIGRKLAEEARQRQAVFERLVHDRILAQRHVHQGGFEPGVELIQKPLTSEQLAAIRKVQDA